MGRAWASITSTVLCGSFVFNSLIEHSWVHQFILVGAFLVCFWTLNPTAADADSSQALDDDLATISDLSSNLAEQLGF